MADSSISSIRYKDISDDKVDIAVTKLKMPCDTHSQPATDFEFENTVSFSSALTMKR